MDSSHFGSSARMRLGEKNLAAASGCDKGKESWTRGTVCGKAEGPSEESCARRVFWVDSFFRVFWRASFLSCQRFLTGSIEP